MFTGVPLFREEPELLRGFREGRPDVLERVYRTYVRAVDRYIRSQARAIGHPELAQASAVADIVQEVFMRAFSVGARAAYDGLREFGPYLSAIARNCVIDALRGRGREILKKPDELSLILADAPTEDEELVDPKVAAVLTRYVRELPRELAGVYEQRFVLGRSQVAASEGLGLSRRALRTAEARLRRGLRQALQRDGISLRELRNPSKDSSTRIPVRAVSIRSQS